MNRAEDITFVLGANTTRFNRGIGAAQSAVKKLLAGAAVGGGTLAIALRKAQQAVSELDKIGKDARAGGLDPETYQEYAFAADLAGLSVSELNKGLRTFAKNSNDAVLGSGLMKTSLERLNPELLENIKNSKSQEERLRLVSDAVKNATSEIEKQAIAQAAFGGKGTAFINFLDQGAAGFDRLSAKAAEMGIIIQNDVVRNAEDMNDKLSTASRIIDANLNKAFVNLAPILVSAAELVADISTEIFNLIDSMRSLENQTTKSLDNSFADTGLKRIEIENEILRLKDEQRGITGVLAQAERRLIDGKINGLKDELAELDKQEAKVIDILKTREAAAKVAPNRVVEGTINPVVSTPKSKKSSRSASISEAEKQAQAIAGVVDALTFELAQLGRNEEQQRLYNELKRAGVDLNSMAGQQISQLVASLEEENRSLEQNEAILSKIKERQDAIREGNEFLISSAADVGVAFTQGSEEGVKALKALIVQLIAAYAQAKLLGTGPLSGLIGGLGGGISASSISPAASLAVAAGTGGLFAKGGISNQPAIFGEAGPEAAVPLPDGRSIPVSLTGVDFSKGGDGMVFSPTYMIDAKDGDGETVKRLERALDKRDRDFYQNVVSVLQDARSRNKIQSV